MSSDRHEAIKTASNIRSNGGSKYESALQCSESVHRLYSLILSETLQTNCPGKFWFRTYFIQFIFFKNTEMEMVNHGLVAIWS